MDHHEAHARAKAQFGKVAASYVTSQDHVKGEELAVMVQLASPLSGKRVLDVATGGGHTALAFARAGAHVTATDITPEMVRAAKTFISQQLGDDAEVNYQLAAAESLPFDDAMFDVVTCRIAPHHFAGPQTFVAEAYQVLKPGGMLLVVDNIAPEDETLAGTVNHLERLRDASHVENYPVSRWISWCSQFGFEIQHLSRWFKHKQMQAWLERSQTPPERRDTLRSYLLSLPLNYQRYLKLRLEGQDITSISHEDILLQAVKPDWTAAQRTP